MDAPSTQNLTDVRLCFLEGKDDSYKQFYEIAQVVTGLAIYPLACILGLMGNALTIFVLSRRNMLTSTNAFLSALAVSDSIKLVNDSMYILVTVLLRTDDELGRAVYGYLYPYAHFVFSMSVSVSSWLTVSVAVERYILICHPTRARAFWNRRRAVVLCVSIYLLMTLLALPSALRYRTVCCMDRMTNMSRVEVELTEIWRNQTLVTCYEWVQTLLRSTIPSVLLIALNICIISAVRRTKAKRLKNPRHRVTIMMIVVIVVFLICITPDAILSTVFGFGYHEAGYLGKGVREVTDSLLTVNAAVNFIIYCVFNQEFRKNFSRICCFTNKQAGWVTVLDESFYNRLTETKYLLSTNNNSSHRQNSTTKLITGTAHYNGPSIRYQGDGVTLVTLDTTNRDRAYSQSNPETVDVKLYTPELISHHSLFASQPDYSHSHNDRHNHHTRVSTSSGLKKSKNSIKCNRAKKKMKITFSGSVEESQEELSDSDSVHQLNESSQSVIAETKPHANGNMCPLPEMCEVKRGHGPAKDVAKLCQVSSKDVAILFQDPGRDVPIFYHNPSSTNLPHKPNLISDVHYQGLAKTELMNTHTRNTEHAEMVRDLPVSDDSENFNRLLFSENIDCDHVKQDCAETRGVCLKDTLRVDRKRRKLAVSFMDSPMSIAEPNIVRSGAKTSMACPRTDCQDSDSNIRGETGITSQFTSTIIFDETYLLSLCEDFPITDV